MLRSVKVLIVIAVVAAAFSLTAFAQAPHTLMYQGKLTDANLDPITAATSVIFTVWDLQDTELGVALWSEEQIVTPDAHGVFTVELGAVTAFPLGLFDGSVRFLSMTVAAEELLPRQPITSVPYAMSSVGFANRYLGYVSVGTSVTSLLALNMKIPGPGYVVLDVTGYWYQYKDGGVSTYGYVSIDSTGGYIDYDAYNYYYHNSYLPQGSYYDAFAVTRVIATDTAGTYTFYLNGFRSSNVTSATLNLVNFKGVYYPYHLGTTTPLHSSSVAEGTAAPPISPEDAASRQQGLDQ